MSEEQNPAAAASEEHAAQDRRAATCSVAWCPVCLGVGAIQPIAPDVIGHLLKAGTEMFLAFRAVIETRAEDFEPPAEPVRLEKIDVG